MWQKLNFFSTLLFFDLALCLNLLTCVLGVERFDERKLSLAERVKIFDSLSAAGPNMSADSAGQIISADAAWQNMSADASGQNIGRPPRIGGATATGWYFRLTLHPRGSLSRDCIIDSCNFWDFMPIKAHSTIRIKFFKII